MTTWLMCCLLGFSVGCLTLVDWNRNPRSLSVFPHRCSWLFLSYNILRENMCMAAEVTFFIPAAKTLEKQIMTRRIYPGLSFKKTLSLAARWTVRVVGGSLQPGLSVTGEISCFSLSPYLVCMAPFIFRVELPSSVKSPWIPS